MHVFGGRAIVWRKALDACPLAGRRATGLTSRLSVRVGMHAFGGRAIVWWKVLDACLAAGHCEATGLTST